MEENATPKASRPSYSPDFAFSDFYLFGYLKYCLRGPLFEMGGELFTAIGVLRDGS
jgi:hypothetical protein